MMNNRFALWSVLALALPLAGCDQKALHTPTPAPQQRVQSAPASETSSAVKAVPAPTQTITIKPAQPGMVYVPVYPQTVYGNPPVIYYPGYVPPPSYSSADMAATGLISFTAGVMLGATMNSSWGWNAWGVHWGGSPVVVYNNRTFVNRTMITDRPFAANRPAFAPGPVRLSGEQQRRLEMQTSFNHRDRFAGGFALRRRG